MWTEYLLEHISKETLLTMKKNTSQVILRIEDIEGGGAWNVRDTGSVMRPYVCLPLSENKDNDCERDVGKKHNESRRQ